MARKLLAGAALILTGICMIAGGWIFRADAATAASEQPDWAANVIRLHVVANSDSEADQELKRAVRDAILAEVTPLFAVARSVDEARTAIAIAVPRIERAAAAVVAARGKSYPIQAELGRFAFPGKAYGTFFLPAGEYTALRVAIGEAKGANWWCVLFPPLCFVDWSTGVVLEPKPGTGGRETVAVPRKDLPALFDEEQLAQMNVRPRLALVEWLKSKAATHSAAPRKQSVPSRIPLLVSGLFTGGGGTGHGKHEGVPNAQGCNRYQDRAPAGRADRCRD